MFWDVLIVLCLLNIYCFMFIVFVVFVMMVMVMMIVWVIVEDIVRKDFDDVVKCCDDDVYCWRKYGYKKIGK